jgi:hypothetical protein
MKSIVIASLATLVGATGAASAAPAAWCKGAKVDAPDLKDLSSKDPREVIKAFVSAECAPNAEVEDHRAEIEKARAAWGKRLGMTEADWADAVAYVTFHDDYSIPAEVASKDLAAASPLDQYAVILKADAPQPDFDYLYGADMFEAKLSETARYAFLTKTCFDQHFNAVRDPKGMTGAEAWWAICQPDFERFDLGKMLDELRADTTHDGALKMKLRIAAYDFPKRIKDHQAEVQKMIQRDDANKKLMEIAAGARTEWASITSKQGKLLDLVLKMDSAKLAQSRKLFDGCGEATSAALADAVSTSITAKSLAGMFDERDSPNSGFAAKATPVLGQSPTVTLAAIAYTACEPKSEISGFLDNVLSHSPASRGPRSYAASKIRGTKLVYDSMDSKLDYAVPHGPGHYYLEGTGGSASSGGVVKGLTKKGEDMEVQLEKTLVQQQDCVKSHKTGRISRIRDSGSVEYESICDKSAMVTHDHTWSNYLVLAKYAPVLKSGVMFSSAGKDVIAVWPSKSAKQPSLVLGGAVK